MRYAIPFSKAQIGREEHEAVTAALDRGQIGGNGALGATLQQRLKQLIGVRHALLTTSCSHALELAAMALRIGPGDEVIMPSFTFVTTASSIVRERATPVFVDIDEETWNIDPAQIEARITPRTRAILPVHYAGQGAAMGQIMEIARRHNLFVIEDAAQGIGAGYSGMPLGSIGHVGCISFHVTKNVVGGEGGVFLTSDDAIAQRAEIIREKGTNRSRFLRGEVDKYTWVDVGSSFVPSDLLSALIIAQLDKMEAMHARRHQIWARYQAGLTALAQQGQIVLPVCRPEASHNAHIYAFRMADPSRRDLVLDRLKQQGIGATFHFIPLHSSPYAMSQWGYQPDDLPVTERVAASLIRLPIYPDLADDEQSYIIETLYEIING